MTFRQPCRHELATLHPPHHRGYHGPPFLSVNGETMTTESANPVNAAVARILERAIEGIDAATSFIAAEIPDVVYQLLLWVQVKSAMTVVIILTAIVFFWKVLIHGLEICKVRANWNDLDAVIRNRWGDEKPSDGEEIIACIGGGLGLAVFIIGFGFSGLPALYNIAQIWVAPKIFLIEYMRNMI